jgi:8-oxo-dGTP diphosphatase
VAGVSVGDGNGWVQCRCGQRHWGLHGAAGLLLLRPGPPVEALLQLRSGWTHQGGTWSLPGGARDSHESVTAAALREAREEVGVEPDAVRVVQEWPGAVHTDWRYTYVVALCGPDVEGGVRNAESEAVRWVPLTDVADLPLHPGLAAAWPVLVRELAPMLSGGTASGTPAGP